MAFSSSLLFAASDHSTVHIFNLVNSPAKNPAVAVAKIISSIHRPPTPHGKKLGKIELYKGGKKGTLAVLAARQVDERFVLLVATSEGVLYQYAIDTQEQGKCTSSLQGQWLFC